MFRHEAGNRCIELLLSCVAPVKRQGQLVSRRREQCRYARFPAEYAAKQGFADRVALLLENGADPNFVGFYKPRKTPYAHALEQGHEQIAAMLKEAGAHRTEK